MLHQSEQSCFQLSWGSRENRSNSGKVLETQICAMTWKQCIDCKGLVGTCTDVEKGHEVLQDLWIDPKRVAVWLQPEWKWRWMDRYRESCSKGCRATTWGIRWLISHSLKGVLKDLLLLFCLILFRSFLLLSLLLPLASCFSLVSCFFWALLLLLPLASSYSLLVSCSCAVSCPLFSDPLPLLSAGVGGLKKYTHVFQYIYVYIIYTYIYIYL